MVYICTCRWFEALLLFNFLGWGSLNINDAAMLVEVINNAIARIDDVVLSYTCTYIYL